MDEAPQRNLHEINMEGRVNQLIQELRANVGGREVGRFREEIRDGRHQFWIEQRLRMEEEIRQLREVAQVSNNAKREDSLFNQVGFLSGLALGSVCGFLCALSFFVVCKVEVTSAKSV